MWHFKQPQSHDPTAKIAHALGQLEDHVIRTQPMSEEDIAECHRVLHGAYEDLDPEDRAHLKMRLGVIGHQHALEEHERREAAAAGTAPDVAAELVKLRSEVAMLQRKNAALSAGKSE